MRKYVVIILLFLLCLTGAAQNGNGLGVGIRAGINLSDLTSSTGSGRAGFVGGAFVDYNISRFGFELGVNYSEQGTLRIVQAGVDKYSTDLMLNYVNLQLLVKYQIFNGFRIFLGPQGSYLVSAVERKNGLNQAVSGITAFDVGVRAGVGFTFRFGLDLSASYNHGFFSVYQDVRKSYTSMFSINVGWRFSLEKKKK